MGKVERAPCSENWLRALRGQEIESVEEYPLFTDAHITGQITEGYGPYQFLNTVPIPEDAKDIQPAIILRVEWHLTADLQGLSRSDATDVGYYHGGDVIDELAALVSLALGIRCKAGGMSRRFNGKDPRGQPYARGSGRDPVFLRRTRTAVLPRAIGSHSLECLRPLKLLVGMSPPAATALIRAARLYQDGLWIAESQPSLSWLMLVSAIETAAVYWRKAEDSPVERLKSSKPMLYDLLENVGKIAGVSDLSEQVAQEVADSLGATKKFIDFVIMFLPDPPAARPPATFQVSWSERNMKKTLRKIYGYRSTALHSGIPFPLPMCDSPHRDAEWEAPAEKPIFHSMQAMGGTWLEKDIPMVLQIFEYIARGALLGWWQSLGTVGCENENGEAIMSQGGKSGARAVEYGLRTARRIAQILGGKKVGNPRSNEYKLKNKIVVIKCARKKTNRVGVPYQMLDRITAILGCFEVEEDTYDVYEMKPDVYRKHMKPSRSAGHSRGGVGMVTKSVFKNKGELLKRINID